MSIKAFEKLSAALEEMELEQWLTEKGLGRVMPLLAEECIKSQAALLSMDKERTTEVLHFSPPCSYYILPVSFEDNSAVVTLFFSFNLSIMLKISLCVYSIARLSLVSVIVIDSCLVQFTVRFSQ